MPSAFHAARKETDLGNSAEANCAVLECEEPGGPDPLIVRLNPRREATLCAEHSVLAKAGAAWFARPLLGGQFVVHMDKSLPVRLANVLTEEATSSVGDCTRFLLQLVDGEGRLSEVEFWAPSGSLLTGLHDTQRD